MHDCLRAILAPAELDRPIRSGSQRLLFDARVRDVCGNRQQSYLSALSQHLERCRRDGGGGAAQAAAGVIGQQQHRGPVTHGLAQGERPAGLVA